MIPTWLLTAWKMYNRIPPEVRDLALEAAKHILNGDEEKASDVAMRAARRQAALLAAKMVARS